MDWQSIQPLFNWLTDHPYWYGLIVFLIAFTESLLIVGLIVPGTVLMFGVGTLVGVGVLDVKVVLLLAFSGAVLGDGVSFWIGARYKQEISQLWPFKDKPHLLVGGKTFFKKHGGKSIFFGRFVGPVRPIVPAVAGMMGMSSRKFIFLNVASAAVWAPFYLIPGMLFGGSIELAQLIGLRVFILIAILLIVVGALYYLFKYAYVHMKSVFYFVSTITLCVLLVFSSRLLIFYNDENFLVTERWLGGDWQLLAERRISLLNFEKERFNIQFLGTADSFVNKLSVGGWQQIDEPNLKSVLSRFAPTLSFDQQVPLYQFHQYKFDVIRLEKWQSSTGKHYMIQIWPSRFSDKNGKRYWLGMLSEQVMVVDSFPFVYFNNQVVESSDEFERVAPTIVTNSLIKKTPSGTDLFLVEF